jgi:alpha-ketoglutarate-dependent taurine dioxygenase
MPPPPLAVVPLEGGIFGAEVLGLDLAAAAAADEPTLVAQLWAATVGHGGLIVVRGQAGLQRDPARFVRFTRGLCRCAAGALEPEPEADVPAEPTEPTAFAEGKALFGGSDVWLPGFPDIRRIGNLHEHGGPPHVKNRVGRQWHLDGHKGAEPLLSFILGVVPGPPGSETLFASGSHAYDALSPAQQQRAESATCVMSNRYRSGGPVAEDFEKGLRMCAEGLSVEQGVAATERLDTWALDERRERPVHLHPETGRKTLLVAPVALDCVEGVEGVDRDSPHQARGFVKELLTPGTSDACVYAHSCELPTVPCNAVLCSAACCACARRCWLGGY